MSKNVTQKTVLNLLSTALFQKPFCFSEEIDWRNIYYECKAQSILALTFSVLPKKNVPRDVFEVWENECRVSLSVSSKLSYAHTVIHKLMEESKIPYVILKGCVSAGYYDNPVLRTMGDVDFLVPEEQVRAVDKLLLSKSFNKKNNHQSVECAYEKDKLIYELHWDVIGIPNNSVGDIIHDYLSDIFEQSFLKKTELAEFYSPSPFHHGLIMLLHVARHMITGGVGLRHFCDWIMFVEKMGDDFSFLFESKLKRVGLWRFAQLISQFCVLYLGADYNYWMGKLELDCLEKLKEDVFLGGNFGHKDLSRADESKFITSQKGGISNISNIKQFFVSSNDIVRKHWRKVSKVPIIYPVGWVFFGGRYALRVMVGKRKKINFHKLTQGAKKRKELYNHFALFELD